MNDDNPPGRREGGPPGPPGSRGHQGLRLLALLTVIAGVLALAAAAFVFSYTPVYDIARAAGIRPGLARFYPALPDAVLVVACAAALMLRGARWWARWLVWLSIIALAALVGGADAVHAMAIKLPRRPVAAAVAVLPWVLLLLGFRLWLSVLRRARKDHGPASPALGTGAATPAMTAAVADAPASGRATDPGSEGPADSVTSATSAPAEHGLDLILPPYPDVPDDSSGSGGRGSEKGDARSRMDDDRAGLDGEGHDRGHSPAPFTADSGARGLEPQATPAAPLGAPVPETIGPEPETIGPEPETIGPEPETISPEPAQPTAESPETQMPPDPAAHSAEPAPKAATDFRRVRSSPVPPDE